MIDDPVPRSAPLNMAIDEALSESIPTPILRFYRWSGPAVSFGYFGRVVEAEEFAQGKTLVRRWTGGGIVPHGEDVTYSILIGSSDPIFDLSARSIYREVHSAIERAFLGIGIQARLSEMDAPRTSEACFANPVVADVIEDNRKIAGAAQRRTRGALLHQGSIQRKGLGKEFRKRMGDALGATILEEQVSLSVLDSAQALADQKYATMAWLRRR